MNPVTLIYTNWKGITAERTIVPERVWFGVTAWHSEPQWFIEALDVDKNEERDFALKGFGNKSRPIDYLIGTNATGSVGTQFR